MGRIDFTKENLAALRNREKGECMLGRETKTVSSIPPKIGRQEAGKVLVWDIISQMNCVSQGTKWSENSMKR